MIQTLIRQFAYAAPTLVLVSVAVFALIHLVPGNPAQVIAGADAPPEEVRKLEAELGLDKPLHIQYGIYFTNLLKGDLGYSYFYKRSVTSLILERVPATLQLGLVALLLSAAIGIPLGIMAARRPGSLIDMFSSLVALVGVSVPNFWLAILLMSLFSVELGWLPVSGRGDQASAASIIRHMVLPGVVLGTALIASTTRLTRASMIEALSQDFVRTASAKGLGVRKVIYKHGLRFGLIPIVTNLGLQVGVLFGGSIITETIFAWPGIGRLVMTSINQRDFPVVQGIVLISAAAFVMINLLVDALYAAIDPRIRYA